MTLLMGRLSRQEEASHESPTVEGPTPQSSLSHGATPLPHLLLQVHLTIPVGVFDTGQGTMAPPSLSLGMKLPLAACTA